MGGVVGSDRGAEMSCKVSNRVEVRMKFTKFWEILKSDPEKLLGSTYSILLASMFFLTKKSAQEAILPWLPFKMTEIPVW